MTRLLVVDSSVIRSAGETDHRVSSSCRACLEKIRLICHRVATTADLQDEWRRHMSRFSRKWRRSMCARKKPLQVINPTCVPLDGIGLTEGDQRAIEKDRCLLEAALSADRVIVTRDRSLQVALAKTRRGKHVMEQITWIDPVDDGAAAIEGL